MILKRVRRCASGGVGYGALTKSFGDSNAVRATVILTGFSPDLAIRASALSASLRINANRVSTDADGVGNSTSQHWTINVDPEGHITATEAEETLEAVDNTSESTIVASTEELIGPEEREAGNNPSLIESLDELESLGTPDPSSISLDPKNGFTVALPETSIHAVPLEVGSGANPPVVAKEAIAVGGNTTPNVDTVIRPVFDGILTFGSIRNTAAPETFSWKVNLGEEQILKSIDPQHTEVDYENGHEAYLITAEPASDAVGTTVPTALSVSEGNIVTLTVKHREGNYVYPVVAGTGWEGGFHTEIIVGPKDQQELKEEQEQKEKEEQEKLEETWEQEGNEADPRLTPRFWLRPERADYANNPPVANGLVEAPRVAGSIETIHYFNKELCSAAGCDHWKAELDGKYRRIASFSVEPWAGPGCELELGVSPIWPHLRYIPYAEVNGYGWNGPSIADRGTGEHLTAWCHFTLFGYPSANKLGVSVPEEPLALLVYIWGDGWVQREWRHWDRGYLE